MRSGGIDRARRALFTARRTPEAWLPWSDPARLLDACTRCGACISACPQRVIVAGDGGFPTVDPARGECSFCGDCARACEAPVFDLGRQPPWPLRAAVGERCLEPRGVSCRLCEDACPERALRIRPRPGGAEVRVDGERCSGCGACVGLCPTTAISLRATHHEAALHD